MEVSPNHLLLQMESKSFRLSCIRFWNIYNSLAGRLSQGSGQVDHDDKKKTLFFFRVRQQKIPTYREGNFYCWGEKFLSVVSVYRGLILVKNLVVFRHGYTEDDGGDILETVDPFFSLWSLAAHVEQLEVEVFEWEVNLDNARGLDPGPQDILLSGLVVLRSQAVQIVKETEKKKFWYFFYRENICVLFFTVKPRWLCISDSLKVTGFILMKSNKFRKDPRQKFGASARFVEMIWESY